MTDAAPSVFAVPPGADFAAAFADGFRRRYAGLAPEAIFETRILVNTSRARDAIEHALADAAPGPLPRLAMIPDLADAPDLAAADLPPAIAPVRRHLNLTRLVERFLAVKSSGGEAIAPPIAAPDLAAELALLIDQMHDSGVPAEALDDVLRGSGLAEAAAAHWQHMRSFLDLVLEAWPKIREADAPGTLDPRARQRAAVAAQIAAWAEAPPRAPVIAAATTGSVASTAELLAALARLPGGAVVLPGLDPDTPDALWEAVAEDHPLGPFRGTLDRLGLRPSDIPLWTDLPRTPRAALLGQALRPAPVTDHWHRVAPALRDDLAAATAGLAVLEAESPRHEAEAIAVALREAVATPGRTAALVTPDAGLARRVGAALGRFAIVPDDTMGQPLLLSAPGRLMRLALDLAADPGDPVALAALVQHPLVTLGLARGRHLAHARAFDRIVLRGRGAGDALPDWPDDDDDARQRATAPEARAWRGALAAAMAPLAEALAANRALADLLAAHAATLEALTARPDDPPAIWQGEAGAMLQGRLSALTRDAAAFGPDPVASYPALLANLLADAQLRPQPRRPHPRIAIIGPREARFLQSDLTVLAGLNEGIWPAAPDPGPWLGRPMRAAMGLPLPERSVGLAAHDFLAGASRGDVILARARKIEGTETVASRWLIRLETLVTGIGGDAAWTALTARGRRLTDLTARLAVPDTRPPRAPRPAPRPPVAARPRRLAVTGLELLVRDAYAVYARHILGLSPLDPLGRVPDARDRGIAIHDVLEQAVAETWDWPGPDAARAIFQQVADRVLDERVPRPDLRGAWRARIVRFRDWFLAEEAARREIGAPLALERRGRLIRDLTAGPFELTARADRIDRRNDGRAAIYDYKSGSPPSRTQIKTGFSHQLHVAAAILADGGFDGVPALESAEAAYLGLTGSGEGGKPVVVEDIAAELPAHMDRVMALLAAYDDPATPYLSRGRIERTEDVGDYDHLARVAEWEDAP